MSARVHRGATASTEFPLPSNLAWMKKARCLRKGHQKFYLSGRPTPKDYEVVKKNWCLPCPVRAECLITCIRQEMKAKYTSQGIQGGATPIERKNIRRKIRDSNLCPVEVIWRWLHQKAVPRSDKLKTRYHKVTLLHSETGAVVYENMATTPRGAHLIAVREQRVQGTELVGVVYCRTGHVIEIIPPTGQGRPQSCPCPSQ